MRHLGIVIGGSAGGLEALTVIFSALPDRLKLPILVVQHLHPHDDGLFPQYLAGLTKIPVRECCDKEQLCPGRIYTAPANYHTLLERGNFISLSVDEPLNWSRPSIDILFDSVARCWGEGAVAVLLSGANEDGAAGLLAVKDRGGKTLVQDPQTAISPAMPAAAIARGGAGEIHSAESLGEYLRELNASISENRIRLELENER